MLITRDALRGHTVSKNGSISFYAGCPEGAYWSKNGSISFFFFFFFFLVATNRHINLFIKLTPLLLGVYCSDCLQKKQANRNPFLSLISLGRGPTHPYLCDVKASLINTGLNLCRHIVNMFWTQVCRFQTEISPF